MMTKSSTWAVLSNPAECMAHVSTGLADRPYPRWARRCVEFDSLGLWRRWGMSYHNLGQECIARFRETRPKTMPQRRGGSALLKEGG